MTAGKAHLARVFRQRIKDIAARSNMTDYDIGRQEGYAIAAYALEHESFERAVRIVKGTIATADQIPKERNVALASGQVEASLDALYVMEVAALAWMVEAA